MDELIIEVEDHLRDPNRIAEELYLRLGLRIDVQLAPPVSLPRFEGKGRRFVDERTRQEPSA
jgi:phenylacetate-CoA ligase